MKLKNILSSVVISITLLFIFTGSASALHAGDTIQVSKPRVSTSYDKGYGMTSRGWIKCPTKPGGTYTDKNQYFYAGKVNGVNNSWDYSNKKNILYCINFGAHITDAEDIKVTSYLTNNFWRKGSTEFNYELTKEQKEGIMISMIYAYPNYIYSNSVSQMYDTTDQFLTAQVFMWEWGAGFIEHNGSEIVFTTDSGYDPYQFYNDIIAVSSARKEIYNQMKANIENHYRMPSLASIDYNRLASDKSHTVYLDWNNSSKQYEGYMTDGNYTLNSKNIRAGSGVSVSKKSASLLYINTNQMVNGGLTFTNNVNKNVDSLVAVNAGQDMLCGATDTYAGYASVVTRGRIKISLLDATTRKNLAYGAVSLYKANGMRLADINLSETEYESPFSLEAGDYYLKQRSAPNGYSFSSGEEFHFKVYDGQWNYVSVYNTPNASAEIKKTSAVDGSALSKAEFAVYKLKDSGERGELYYETPQTASNGIVSFNLPAGKYALIETKAPQGYALSSEEKKFTVAAGKTERIVFEDEIEGAFIRIKKTDDKSGKPLSGTKFSIYREVEKKFLLFTKYEYVYVETITTDATGYATSGKLAAGKYKVSETSAPYGYKASGESITVELTSEHTAVQSTVTVNVTNTYVGGGRIYIHKYAEDTGKPLAGAVFNINGETLITDADGVAVSSKLTAGREYSVSETKAPEGYYLAPSKWAAVSDGTDTHINITDPVDTGGTVIIYKYDYDTGKPLAGAEFTLRLKGDATSIKLTTDSNGVASCRLEKCGTYTYKETTFPEFYVSSFLTIKPAPNGQSWASSSGEFTITPKNQNKSLTIANSIGTGSISVKFDTEDKKSRNGAEFRIVNEEYKFDETVKTDFSGLVSLKNLKAGKYIVTQTKTPNKNYEKAEDAVIVNVPVNETVQVDFYNRLVYYISTDIKLSANEVEYGQPLKATLSVTNYGDKAAKNIMAVWTVLNDNYLYLTVPANSTETFEVDLPTDKAGQLRLYWMANADGEVLYEYDYSDNSGYADYTVIGATNLYAEYIEPNSSYRASCDIIIAYKLYNDGKLDITPDDELLIMLKVTYLDASGVRKLVDRYYNEAVIVPKDEYQLVYFLVSLPEETAGRETAFALHINNSGTVTETDYSDNLIITYKTVEEKPQAETPNPVFNLRCPGGVWTQTDDIPTRQALPSLSWEEWKYNNSTMEFVKKTYTAHLSANAQITPDYTVRSAKRLENDIWSIKSGYSVNLNIVPQISLSSEADTGSVTVVQNVAAYFPEFGYSRTIYRSLEKDGGNTNFILAKNPDSIRNERKHFTPMWYKDGKYIVQVYAYDVWTPAGMLSIAVDSNEIQIKGNMYDDYYSSRG